MSDLRQVAFTTVAKKFVIALSGLGLVVYVVLHLLGNLALYRSDSGGHFNAYAAQLHSWGTFLTVAELALLAVFLVHIALGLVAKKNNWAARGQGYRMWKSKGGGTPSNFSSRSMWISGSIILIFTAIHVWQFRFGPGVEQGYVTTQGGEQVRDLYKLVVEVLKNPFMAGFYILSMILLGVHLRHGIWSAFQSLGATSPRTTRNLRVLGAVMGVVLALGFLLIPVWIYFGAQA